MRRAFPAVVAVAVLAGCGGSGGDEAGAIVYCHQFVERELRSPSSADFPSFTDHKVVATGDMQWRVSAWVDAENAFGAVLRVDWSCEISYNESAETWTLEGLSGP